MPTLKELNKPFEVTPASVDPNLPRCYRRVVEYDSDGCVAAEHTIKHDPSTPVDDSQFIKFKVINPEDPNQLGAYAQQMDNSSQQKFDGVAHIDTFDALDKTKEFVNSIM